MTQSTPAALAIRWIGLWRRLAGPSILAPSIEPLLNAYRQPSRHYHHLNHIEQCLREFDSLRLLCDSPDAVEAALWFHDVIYDPRRSDNEEQSAEQAAVALNVANVSESVTNNIVGLILATKHDGRSLSPDAQILVDIDLSILGQAPALFDEYERAIRLEYSHLEQQAFNEGRAKILRRFLERPMLFHTETLGKRYEWQARENLRRSIARLAAAQLSGER